MISLPYNLKSNFENSDNFYEELEYVSQEFEEIFFLKYFERKDFFCELFEKSNYRFLLKELLIFGVLLKNYYLSSQNRNGFLLNAIYKMNKLRKFKYIKRFIDFSKGILIFLFNKRQNSLENEKNINIEQFECFLNFINKIGEYSEEILIINKIYQVLNKKRIVFKGIKEILSLAEDFERYFNKKLNIYTYEHRNFINSFNKKKFREDFYLCNKSKNEYYLNMYMASLMNRDMEEEYKKKELKLLFLPTCMRVNDGRTCKASKKDDLKICNLCNTKCNIFKIKKEVENERTTIYLLEHNSDLTNTISKINNNKNIGIIGVACVPNLINGGLKLERAGIAAQCVILDNSGCKKHWTKKGIQTNLNINQLKKKL